MENLKSFDQRVRIFLPLTSQITITYKVITFLHFASRLHVLSFLSKYWSATMLYSLNVLLSKECLFFKREKVLFCFQMIGKQRTVSFCPDGAILGVNQ